MSLLTDNLRRARSLGVSFKAALIMLILSFISILFEGVGIVMLLPIFDYVQHNGDVDKLLQQNGYWAYIVDTLNWLDIPVALPSLLAISFAAILARQIFTFLRIRYRAQVLFSAIHHIRERVFHLSLRAQTSRQEGTLVGEAVIDVSVELPKAIAALYGTVDFVSQLLLIAAYLVGLFLLAPWMTAVSIGLLAVTALLLLGLFRRKPEDECRDHERQPGLRHFPCRAVALVANDATLRHRAGRIRELEQTKR